MLRLEEDPRYKSGVALYYLGGDRSHTILGNNSSGVSIYHPNGDVKKIAVFNSVTSDSNTSVVANKPSYGVAPGQDTPNGRAAVGGWESDGAPLLNSNKRLIGFYPSIVCTYPICLDQKPGMCYRSCYNKLSVAWLNNSTDYQRRLKEGLDPLNLGVTTGDGLESVDPCASNKTLSGTLATQTATGNNITMQNVTILSGAVVKVKACNIISVGPNVIVNTGATLELEAGGSVRIDYSTFKVMAGASFIIK